MKLFFEMDLERGNGSVRWEHATGRKLRRVATTAGSLLAVIAAVVTWMLQRL